MITPNLLIIGAMKCGTTSLHNYLNMHPDIQMSDNKEINFFCNDELYQKGSSWYSSFFQKGYRYNGESSTNYTKRHTFPKAASRIKEHLGREVKLIYVVRDPIDRVQSNFTDSKTYGDIPSYYDINTYIENKQEDNPFLKTSMYYYQMQAYLEHFDVSTMYFITSDDLKKNPQATMDALFGFLGLEPVMVEQTEVNQTASKTYYSTNYLKVTQSPLVCTLKKIIPSKLLLALRNSSTIKDLSKKKIDPTLDVISDQNRALLKSYLMDDMKKFEELTKIKF